MGTILCNDICIPLGKNHLLARQQTTEPSFGVSIPFANASLACPTGSHPLSWISSLLYPYGYKPRCPIGICSPGGELRYRLLKPYGIMS